MKAKEYAFILEKLVRDAESEENLNEKMRGFLAYMKEKNNTPLLGKIMQELERKWRRDVWNIRVEVGEKSEESERAKKQMREILEKKGIAARVTEKANPRLISGMRINVDDNYLIEASLEGALNQMFNERGLANYKSREYGE